MGRYKGKITRGLVNIDDALAVRRAVFTDEQGFADGADDTDAAAYQVVLYDGEKPIATGRAFSAGGKGVYHIGRVAVLEEYRHEGTGSVVMELLENKLRQLGAHKAVLAAQQRSVGFYQARGYKPAGDWYEEQGYPHREMEKTL